MSSEKSVQIADLNKVYAIYDRPADRLKQMLFGRRHKYYKEFWALRQISFEVARGESIGIIGRNGAGKSSLLQIIAGTVQPTSGHVEVKGKVAALLELGTGFNPEFTGRENVHLAASIMGLSSEQIAARFDAILQFAGIGEFIDQPVKLYSSGMYARLAFAVAAHVDADILIIDEILAVGDASFTHKCMRFIEQFKRTGTIIFVSHDTNSVVTLCSRAVWLENGMLRAIGPAKDVCHDYVASINQEAEDASTFQIGGVRKEPPKSVAVVRDVRSEVLVDSNKIEIFEFDSQAPWFGRRGASIIEVRLEDSNGQNLPLLAGGEEVRLCISCRAEKELSRPIVGFFIKNKLGQYVFGDNTYVTYKDHGFSVHKEMNFCAVFTFQMPFLPSGDYAILAAVAEGTQSDHVQHHWIDEALFFRVHSSFVAQGLVGIPMLKIAFEMEGQERRDAANAQT